jgi:Helix-turn-helix of DDE superfamily endonuclease
MAGLTSDQVDQLVIDVYAHGGLNPARRRAVGPYRAVLVVLLYLRHNLSQTLVAELFGCSQPTVSRLIGRLAPVIRCAVSRSLRRPRVTQPRLGSPRVRRSRRPGRLLATVDPASGHGERPCLVNGRLQP